MSTEAIDQSRVAGPEEATEEEIAGLDQHGLKDDEASAGAPGGPQTNDGPAPEKPKEVLDTLRPIAKSVEWNFGPNGELTYVQRPLSFIGKMEWFAKVGEVLDSSMGGENPLSMGSLLDAPTSERGLTMNDFRDADTFVHAVGKLVAKAPDFLFESYFIWLNVPTEQRDLLMRVWRMPDEEGGLTDEQGLAIIETFIDQNYGALDRFFRDRVTGLGRRLAERRKAAEASQQSKPSKPSVGASGTP